MTSTKQTIDKKIELLKKEIDEHGLCYDAVHFNLYEAQGILARLEELKRIHSAEMPVEPGFLPIMRKLAAKNMSASDDALLIEYIDALKDRALRMADKSKLLQGLHDLGWAQKECAACGTAMASTGIDNAERAESLAAENAKLKAENEALLAKGVGE